MCYKAMMSKEIRVTVTPFLENPHLRVRNRTLPPLQNSISAKGSLKNFKSIIDIKLGLTFMLIKNS